MRSWSVVCGVALAVALAACSERAQTNHPDAQRKADVPDWKGGNAAYTVAGWTPGEKASWDEQLRKRAQHQNDYAPR